MNFEEAILDRVRRLPPAKQEQVLRFADGLQQGPLVKIVPSRDLRCEMEWLEENRARYADQWVVVEGKRLIAADVDGHKAFAAAKAAGIDVPFLVHVLPEDTLPFVPGCKCRYRSSSLLPVAMRPPMVLRSRPSLVWVSRRWSWVRGWIRERRIAFSSAGTPTRSDWASNRDGPAFPHHGGLVCRIRAWGHDPYARHWVFGACLLRSRLRLQPEFLGPFWLAWPPSCRDHRLRSRALSECLRLV